MCIKAVNFILLSSFVMLLLLFGTSLKNDWYLQLTIQLLNPIILLKKCKEVKEEFKIKPEFYCTFTTT